jgi:hypothetical protein
MGSCASGAGVYKDCGHLLQEYAGAYDSSIGAVCDAAELLTSLKLQLKVEGPLSTEDDSISGPSAHHIGELLGDESERHELGCGTWAILIDSAEGCPGQ